MNKFKIFLEKQGVLLQVLVLLCAVLSAYYAFEAASLQKQQLVISEEQKRLATHQVKQDERIVALQRQASMPVFSVGVRLIGTENGRRQEELQISAERNPSYNADYRIWAKLVVTRSKVNTTPSSVSGFVSSYSQVPIETAVIPVSFYAEQIKHFHNDHYGLLVSAPISNPGLAYHVQQTLESFEKDPQIRYQVRLERFLELKFNTADGLTHKKYFVFTPHGTGKPVMQEEFLHCVQLGNSQTDANESVNSAGPSPSEIVQAWNGTKRLIDPNET